MRRTRLLTISCSWVLLLSAWIRYDAYVSDRNRPDYITLPLHYSAAVGFAMGHGLHLFPTPHPNVDSTGRLLNPSEFLRPSEFPGPSEVLGQPHPVTESLKPFTFNPGLPIALGTGYRLFGFENKYYQIFQLVLSFFHTALVLYLTWRLSGSIVATVFAGVAHALFLPEVRFSLYIGREIYTTTAILLCALAFVQLPAVFVRRRVWPWAFAIGLGIGLCALFRTTALLFVVPAAAFCVSLAGWKPSAWKKSPWKKSRGWLVAAVLILGCLTPVVPWCLRNQALTGQFRISDESQYFAAWAGLGYQRNSVGANATDTFGFNSLDHAMLLRRIQHRPYYEGGGPDYERMARELYAQYLWTQPFSFMRSYLKSIWVNLTVHNHWAYYQLRETSFPSLELTSQSVGKDTGAALMAVVEFFLRHYGTVVWMALLLVGAARREIIWLAGVILLGSMHISAAAAYNQRYTTHLYVAKLVLGACLLSSLLTMRWTLPCRSSVGRQPINRSRSEGSP